MTSPRVSTITSSVSVAWSDATPFTGYYLFVLRDPSNGVTPWAELSLNTHAAGIRLPFYCMIPIVQGQPNTTVGLLYNADITPPTTQYIAYLYDSGKRQIAGPSAPFTVSTATFTPPSFTATIPNTYGTNPAPDS